MGCAILAAWLLASAPPRPASSAPIVRLHVTATPAAVSAEPLFAVPPINAMPGVTRSGPPQLIGIVGRVTAPLAMVRVEDGAVHTIGPGAAAGGWTLQNVLADRATFRRGNEARVSVLPPR